jgi:hypothetical protein
MTITGLIQESAVQRSWDAGLARDVLRLRATAGVLSVHADDGQDVPQSTVGDVAAGMDGNDDRPERITRWIR